MSPELLSVDRMKVTEPFVATEYQADHTDDAPAVREQALEIIDSVLGRDVSEDSETAARLRAHVANHPEEPERALLEHLMETGRINRAKVPRV